MAGMKETPRQKMIGMMYLVLTALLALQVSDALLQKFVLLNNSLETANASAVQKSGQTVEGIKAKINDSPNPSQYADILAKANQVRKMSDAMVSDMELVSEFLGSSTSDFDVEWLDSKPSLDSPLFTELPEETSAESSILRLGKLLRGNALERFRLVG